MQSSRAFLQEKQSRHETSHPFTHSRTRPYVVIEANPARNLGTNPDGAHQLAAFLTSPAGQNTLQTYAARANKSLPIFYPVSATTGDKN